MNSKKILLFLSLLLIYSCDVMEQPQGVNSRLYRIPQSIPLPQPAYPQPSGDWHYLGQSTMMLMTVKSYVDRATIKTIDNSLKWAWIKNTSVEPSSGSVLIDVMFLREYDCNSRKLRVLGVIQSQPERYSSMKPETHWQPIAGGFFDKEYRYICNKTQKNKF